VSELELARLLPTVYRLRDFERGGPLEAILRLVEDQARLVKADVEGLWDDFFVETSAEWVVPYIGDLVSNVPLHEGVVGRRADVGRTIRYRRRKGVRPMLEQLAADVTGWSAHVVACFELCAWTQNVNHLRPQATVVRVGDPAAKELPPVDPDAWRVVDALDLIDSAFEVTPHTVDVRKMTRTEGRYGIQKVAFFLWRLEAFRLEDATAARVTAGDPLRYTFSPLGGPTQLFVPEVDLEEDPETEEVEQNRIVGEPNVRGPLRPLAFHRRKAELYGAGATVFVSGIAGSANVVCRDLSDWNAAGFPMPAAGTIAIDVRLGRILYGTGPAATPLVTYCYGFPAPIGGGPYARYRRLELEPEERRFAAADPLEDSSGFDLVVRVPTDAGTIGGAVTTWAGSIAERTLIEIEDNRTYPLPAGGLVLPAAVGRELVVQARNGVRPVLTGDIRVNGLDEASLTLDGIVLSGTLRLPGELERLELRHCTLVPGIGLDADGDPTSAGTPSLDGAASTKPRSILVSRSIVGSIRLPAELTELEIRDSVVDAPDPGGGASRIAIAGNAAGTAAGPACTLERVTVFGDVFLRELRLGSNSIFDGVLNCERTQAGCIRYSWFDREVSRPPRRFRCQPDLALESAPPAEAAAVLQRVRPPFTTVRYGEPAYAQLALRCPPEILTGAEDGSEMGVYSLLRQPHREANLRVRLDEYLPFGLEPGLVYVT
jgi:hypothetical protein